MNFDHAIKTLVVAREGVIASLRKPHLSEDERRATLASKTDLDKAIGCLRLCEKYDIEPNVTVTVLPEKDTRTVLSEYRVLEDCETDDRAKWIEVKAAGHPVRPIPGALIIEKSGT